MTFRAFNLAALPGEMIDFENLKCLRVLNFENLDFEGKKLPEGIGKLIHLRLLAFRMCRLEELPSSIGDLPFLHTIILDLLNTPKIPNVLWRIKQLRYLRLTTSEIGSEGKIKLGSLDKLEILEGFDSKSCEVTDLSKLKSLRRLQARIDGNDDLSKFIDSIEVKGKYLEVSLTIFGCDFSSEEGRILLRKVFTNCSIASIYIRPSSNMGKLPEYEPGFCQNLVDLWLFVGAIPEDPMSTLEKLPKLKRLHCWQNSFVGREMICHAGGFPQLRYLTLLGLRNLEKWTVEEGAMPQLLRLQLTSCKKLEMIPAGLRFITTLQTLDISGMPKEFKNRVAEGGEDFEKVRHVNAILTVSRSGF